MVGFIQSISELWKVLGVLASFFVFKEIIKLGSNKDTKDFPNKRDYIYMVIIFAIILVYMSGEHLASSINFENMLNFTATITSIILAVIAIIISLNESAKTASSNNKIVESAEKIVAITESLTTASESLIDIRDDLEKTVTDKVDSIHTKVDEFNQEVLKILSSRSKLQSKTDSQNDLDDTYEIKIELSNYINRFAVIEKSKKTTAKILYLMSKTEEFDFIDSKCLGDFIKHKESSDMYRGYYLGLIRGLAALGLLKAKKESYILHEKLLLTIKDMVEEDDEISFEVDQFLENYKSNKK